jgi:hypothetical protein
MTTPSTEPPTPSQSTRPPSGTGAEQLSPAVSPGPAIDIESSPVAVPAPGDGAASADAPHRFRESRPGWAVLTVVWLGRPVYMGASLKRGWVPTGTYEHQAPQMRSRLSGDP